MGGGGISEKDKLGDVGYKAVLNNLPSSLKQYNGETTSNVLVSGAS
jgi:hypothetical protein